MRRVGAQQVRFGPAPPSRRAVRPAPALPHPRNQHLTLILATPPQVGFEASVFPHRFSVCAETGRSFYTHYSFARPLATHLAPCATLIRTTTPAILVTHRYDGFTIFCLLSKAGVSTYTCLLARFAVAKGARGGTSMAAWVWRPCHPPPWQCFPITGAFLVFLA